MRILRSMLALALAALLLSPLPARAAIAAAPFVAEVAAPFRDYYDQHHGPRTLGQPLTGLLDVGGYPAQYFEKGRLEDHRGEHAGGDWAVMFGRLTAELIERDPPLRVNDTALRYTDLRRLADPRLRHAPPPAFVGGVQIVDSGVFVPYDAGLRPAPGYVVPPILWSYLNRPELFPDGWIHDLGLPLADAVWTETTKAGEVRPVLLQAFERAVLTYDIRNPADWQIERGNIGADALRTLPAPDAIELPTPGARLTLPLHLIARVGRPGEQIAMTLRWQDGTTLNRTATTLHAGGDQGLLIESLDWSGLLQPPQLPTQPATLQLRRTTGELLAERGVTVLGANDPATQLIDLYWVDGDRPRAEQRRIPRTDQIGAAVLDELLWGPSPARQPALTSALPTPAEVLSYGRRAPDWGARVRLLGFTFSGGIATADFGPELRAYGCGSERVRLIREQITRTLQQFGAVREVRIMIAGQPAPIFAPPTGLIELPGPGACVTEPLHLLARVGTPGEDVTALLRWQDGAVVSQRFPVLRGESGRGLVIGNLDWLTESTAPGPGTREATLELRGPANQLLAQQSFTVICVYDQCTVPIQLSFYAGDDLQHVHRRIHRTDRIAAAALEELLWGPAPRMDYNLTTALPTPEEVLTYGGRAASWGPRVRLLDLSIAQGVATANFSEELRAYGGDPARRDRIRAQITTVLGQFGGVREVRVLVAGKALE